MRKFFLLSFFSIYFISCAFFHQSFNIKSSSDKLKNQNRKNQNKWSLEFKKDQILPRTLNGGKLPVGGLSGLAYNPFTGYFYALSDAKKNHRLYRLALKKKPDYHFEIVDSIFLKEPDQTPLSRNMDPEELVFYNKETLFISSEGQQIYDKHEPTQIFTFRLPGFSLEKPWPLPSVFWPPGQTKQKGDMGQQSNKGFESLAIDRARNRLWTGTEEPLFQDLKVKKGLFLRLSEFDIKSQQLVSQFLYPIEKKAGLTAMFFLKDKAFLSLERVFDGLFFTIQIFITECQRAENVKDEIILKKKSYKFCAKKKLWSSSELDLLIDNLEGMSLTPIENSNKELLILISDNNFKDFQKNQVLFFELSRPSKSKIDP